MGTPTTATASLISKQNALKLAPLRSPSPAGRLMSASVLPICPFREAFTIRFVRMMARLPDTKPPRGRGGPQRSAVDRGTRETSDAVAVVGVPIQTLFHQEQSAEKPPLMWWLISKFTAISAAQWAAFFHAL